MLNSILNRRRVSKNAQPADNSLRLVTQVAMMSKGLPRMDIRDVHLHEGNVHADEGVADGDTGVRVSTGVDDDGVDVPARCVDAVHYRALRVGLEGLERGRERGSLLLCVVLHVLEGCRTV